MSQALINPYNSVSSLSFLFYDEISMWEKTNTEAGRC